MNMSLQADQEVLSFSLSHGPKKSRINYTVYGNPTGLEGSENYTPGVIHTKEESCFIIDETEGMRSVLEVHNGVALNPISLDGMKGLSKEIIGKCTDSSNLAKKFEEIVVSTYKEKQRAFQQAYNLQVYEALMKQDLTPQLKHTIENIGTCVNSPIFIKQVRLLMNLCPPLAYGMESIVHDNETAQVEEIFRIDRLSGGEIKQFKYSLNSFSEKLGYAPLDLAGWATALQQYQQQNPAAQISSVGTLLGLGYQKA